MPVGQLGERLAELLVELQALGELGEAQRGFVLVGAAGCRTTSRSWRRPRSGGRTGGIACSRGYPSPGGHGPARAVSTCTRGRASRSTVEREGRRRGCSRKPSTSASATTRGSAGAPSSSSVTVRRAQMRPGDARARPAERPGGRSRRTGAGRAGSSRAGAPRRRAAPAPSRTACGRRPAGRRPAGPRSTPGPAGPSWRAMAAVDAEAGEPGDRARRRASR